MQRFYVEAANIRDQRAYFSQEQVKYLHKVLRLREGAEVAVTNGLGQAYLCRLHSFSRDGGVGVILQALKEDKEPRLEVILYQGVSKGDKMDHTVQKSVELGVREIIPVLTRRSVVHLEGEKAELKSRRWQKIAAAAMEQSGRNFLPPVQRAIPFAQAVQEAAASKGSLSILPWEEEGSLSLRGVLTANPSPQRINLFIGPEGGFSPGEAGEAARAGISRVTLGPRILRTETAGPAVIAMILYHFGELG
jgi:16S rRNA (uracil1498-N3)-methyltransferase